MQCTCVFAECSRVGLRFLFNEFQWTGRKLCRSRCGVFYDFKDNILRKAKNSEFRMYSHTLRAKLSANTARKWWRN